MDINRISRTIITGQFKLALFFGANIDASTSAIESRIAINIAPSSYDIQSC